MFFTVTRDCNSWKFESDPGWHKFGQIWAKGYAVDRTLEQVAATYNFKEQPIISGNFCLVKIDGDRVDIGHSLNRSFPLWANKECVSNLQPVGEQIWADTLIYVDPMGFHKTQIKISESLTMSLTMDQVADLIVDTTVADAKLFTQHNTLPIRTFRSGGLDTALLYSLVQYLKIDHSEFPDKVFETNSWIQQNQHWLQNFWAYNQLHHWNEPNTILTGSQGDEYFLRGPAVIAMIMAWHDIDFSKILEKNPDAYHHWYFSKPGNLEVFKQTLANRVSIIEQYPTWKSLCDQIVNVLVNDHQHWHLGQTLTWTPQKNLDFARWALCMDIDQLVHNSLHGSLTKACIHRLMPEALAGIHQFKNKPNQ